MVTDAYIIRSHQFSNSGRTIISQIPYPFGHLVLKFKASKVYKAS